MRLKKIRFKIIKNRRLQIDGYVLYDVITGLFNK